MVVLVVVQVMAWQHVSALLLLHQVLVEMVAVVVVVVVAVLVLVVFVLAVVLVAFYDSLNENND